MSIWFHAFVGFAYQGKDIVFRFIISGFLKDDILACVET